jgi:hypothetical protein
MIVQVPDDLANLMLEDGVASSSAHYRSSVPKLIADALNPTLVTITLLQGPLTVIQLRSYIETWLERRRREKRRVTRLQISGPGVDIAFDVDANVDASVLAQHVHRAMFGSPHASHDDGLDDLLSD